MVARASASRERAREWKERDELEGHFVISEIPGTELKTKIYSLFLDSNEKLLNTNFVQFFKIYNFCFRYFFI